jgi:hypothetical protein
MRMLDARSPLFWNDVVQALGCNCCLFWDLHLQPSTGPPRERLTRYFASLSTFRPYLRTLLIRLNSWMIISPPQHSFWILVASPSAPSFRSLIVFPHAESIEATTVSWCHSIPEAAFAHLDPIRLIHALNHVCCLISSSVTSPHFYALNIQDSRHSSYFNGLMTSFCVPLWEFGTIY